jgi:hypothetical protein
MLQANELNDLRQAVLRGEEIPRDKMRAVIDSLRVRRKADIEAASERKTKAKAKSETTDADLDSILGL